MKTNRKGKMSESSRRLCERLSQRLYERQTEWREEGLAAILGLPRKDLSRVFKSSYQRQFSGAKPLVP
jgi:hypothetical protein